MEKIRKVRERFWGGEIPNISISEKLLDLLRGKVIQSNLELQIDNCYESYKPVEIICQKITFYHFKFKDGFECAIDEDGIIWIKQKSDKYFDRPCMKYCFTEIKIRDENIAKYVLKTSCEIQDNEIITKRAEGYL